jgi:hypothetical protein
MSSQVRVSAIAGTLMVLAFAVVSGCSAPSSHRGTISGILAAIGGPPPGLPRPLPGSVRLLESRTHASRVVSVGADGRYSVAVAPGTYLLVGRSPLYNGGTAYNCRASSSTVVIADRTSSLDVFCQEK